MQSGFRIPARCDIAGEDAFGLGVERPQQHELRRHSHQPEIFLPLENLLLASDPADYRGLFTARIGSLTGLNAYPPNALNFYGLMPNARVDDVPMVVISSNRGAWMRKLLDNARKHGRFAYGYLTTNTFKDGAVPWYVPARSTG